MQFDSFSAPLDIEMQHYGHFIRKSNIYWHKIIVFKKIKVIFKEKHKIIPYK